MRSNSGNGYLSSQEPLNEEEIRARLLAVAAQNLKDEDIAMSTIERLLGCLSIISKSKDFEMGEKLKNRIDS